ncbi:Formate/nitrite transporter FocA, FNT family [Faunimonas pinastri]|uniref:Formate/nitrite transporter FocA, FNT family n=1 Tax=Faunimonas pinastri TaxID=1855383 RepID=A0A1H9FE28_9HYPH|nr:formate/nitrite transporter family protein [Faunimonas pinastri]SEQ36201.1 Formate/nitrite transporter FocA, FNT family [Faunimonas pinastri]
MTDSEPQADKHRARHPEEDETAARDQRRDGGRDDAENEAIEEAQSLSAVAVYEVVRREGDEELSRPATSLWWSGVAAGLSISFSLLAQSLLETHLPDTGWRSLISSSGYCVGFLMVVLGRQQLFTENTITAILPLAKDFSASNLGRVGRLWSIVFLANMAGTLFAALFCTFTPVLQPEIYDGMLRISRVMMANDWWSMLIRGISAGFLIATMVWLIPSAEGAKFHTVTLITYLIALGGFTHIIAGSMEAFLLMLHGEIGILTVVGGFMLPVLLGNIIGGTALFAVLAHAQVMNEI